MSEKPTWKKSTTWLQDHIKQNPWIKRLQSYMLNTHVSNKIEQIYNKNPVKAQMLIEYYEYGTTKSTIDFDTLSQFQLVEYYINKLNPNNYRLTDEIVPLIKEYFEIGEINQNTKDLVAKAWDLLIPDYEKLQQDITTEFAVFKAQMDTLAQLYNVNMDEIEPVKDVVEEIPSFQEYVTKRKDELGIMFDESDNMFETLGSTYLAGRPSELMSHTIRRKPEKINAEPPVVDKPEFEFYE
jgi:hypothetical protein